MARPLVLLAVLVLATLATGCNTTGARIRANRDTFDALDPATQQAVKRGEVHLGYTAEMVEIALGRPSQVAGGMRGTDEDATWLYRNFHRNENDYVIAGHRRRVVFDPQRPGNAVVYEPADPRAHRHLIPHTLHIGFRDGRVIAIQRVEDL